MEKNHLTVNILGVSLTLKSKETPEYIKQIIRYFQGKLDEAGENLVTVDPLKILIMAGLNITEELLKERNARMKQIKSEVDPVELEEKLEKFTARMITKIDESLMEH